MRGRTLNDDWAVNVKVESNLVFRRGLSVGAGSSKGISRLVEEVVAAEVVSLTGKLMSWLHVPQI